MKKIILILFALIGLVGSVSAKEKWIWKSTNGLGVAFDSCKRTVELNGETYKSRVKSYYENEKRLIEEFRYQADRAEYGSYQANLNSIARNLYNSKKCYIFVFENHAYAIDVECPGISKASALYEYSIFYNGISPREVEAWFVGKFGKWLQKLY